MATNDDKPDALRILRGNGRELRASLASILANTEALRRVDATKTADTGEAFLDAIWRDATRALEIANVLVMSSSAGPAVSDEAARAAAEPKVGFAYFRWVQSRLAHIEALHQDGRREELAAPASQLKASASSLGYAEIAEAAGAIERASGTSSMPMDACVEILRRVVNRAIRKPRGAAA